MGGGKGGRAEGRKSIVSPSRGKALWRPRAISFARKSASATKGREQRAAERI